MHLKSTRKGWENERLSSFLLSRIAFISHPSSIADDIGSDFLCTLFEVRLVEGEQRDSEQLFPLSSFAIQIKTGEPCQVDVTKHMTYLRSLELPFYLGFVDTSQKELSIYSGHHLSAFFSGVGDLPSKLEIQPVDVVDQNTIYSELRASAQNPSTDQVLKFPLVTKLHIDDSAERNNESRQKLLDSCRLSQLDIGSKSNNEHFYHLTREISYVVAGSGSMQTYRHNLCKRLAEAFQNLCWQRNHGTVISTAANTAVPLQDEFFAYEALYQRLIDLGFREPHLADNFYHQASTIFRPPQ